MGKTKSIKKNFVMNATLTVAAILFPIISNPYVNRHLGPTGTGSVDFAVSIVGYFSLFALLGIPYYGIRIVAQVRNDQEELNKVVQELLIINLITSLITTLAFIPSVFLIPQLNDDKALFFIVGITIWLNSIGLEFLYKGLEQYSYITIRSLIFKFIALVSIFFLIHEKEDYVIYGGITIFASSASNIMNLIHSRKLISYKRQKSYNFRRHLKPAIIFFAMSCATTIYLHLDTAMLGFIVTKTDAGHYGSAVRIKTILVGVVTSLGAVILPRVSYYIEHDLMDDFKRVTQKALKFVFVVATPLMVYFMFFADESILFMSGPKYIPSIMAMRVIMPTLLFIGITNLIGIQIFVPLGKEKYVLYSEIAGAITDLILNAILIPSLKATGAAIGTVVAEFVVLLVQFILLHKIKDKCNIYELFKHVKYWKIIVAIAISIPCGIWIKFVDFKFFDGKLPKESLCSAANYLSMLAISAACYFLAYYIIMMILKDDMVREITSTVFGKLKRKKA